MIESFWINDSGENPYETTQKDAYQAQARPRGRGQAVLSQQWWASSQFSLGLRDDSYDGSPLYPALTDPTPSLPHSSVPAQTQTSPPMVSPSPLSPPRHDYVNTPSVYSPDPSYRVESDHHYYNGRVSPENENGAHTEPAEPRLTNKLQYSSRVPHQSNHSSRQSTPDSSRKLKKSNSFNSVNSPRIHSPSVQQNRLNSSQHEPKKSIVSVPKLQIKPEPKYDYHNHLPHSNNKTQHDEDLHVTDLDDIESRISSIPYDAPRSPLFSPVDHSTSHHRSEPSTHHLGANQQYHFESASHHPQASPSIPSMPTRRPTSPPLSRNSRSLFVPSPAPAIVPPANSYYPPPPEYVYSHATGHHPRDHVPPTPPPFTLAEPRPSLNDSYSRLFVPAPTPSTNHHPSQHRRKLSSSSFSSTQISRNFFPSISPLSFFSPLFPYYINLFFL